MKPLKIERLLSPADLHSFFVVDAEAGRLHWKPRPVDPHNTRPANAWNARYAGKPALDYSSGGYRKGELSGFGVSAHRIIYAMTHGEWPNGEIDHINGNRGDNRISNLRAVTPSGNCRNRALRSDNTTGFVGIYRAAKKWIAYINADYERKYLGSFATLEDAVAARRAEEKLLGFGPNHGARNG